MNNSLLVYGLLADAIRDGQHPVYSEIAERLGIDIKTVGRCVSELRQAGYLDTARCRSDRRRYEYRLTGHVPPWYERLIGWLYRFTPNERNARMWTAAISSRVFYKAREVRGRRAPCAEFEQIRRALFDQYPDLCNVSSVWPVETAMEIEQQLNELLDWEKLHEPSVALAAVHTDE
jgi:DNA-binding Lrp family transcriptional regulator